MKHFQRILCAFAAFIPFVWLKLKDDLSVSKEDSSVLKSKEEIERRGKWRQIVAKPEQIVRCVSPLYLCFSSCEKSFSNYDVD